MKNSHCLLLLIFWFQAGCKSTPAQAIPTPVLEDTRLNETSGLAASVANPGLYYVHNDSGDTSRFFAISPDGHLKGMFYFNGEPGLSPFGVRDCEDIAVGPGPQPGASYVYVGDIGDNNAQRPLITIYRIKEPAVSSGGQPAHVEAEPLYLKYPDGPRDAETLMVDSIGKLLYIISKREDTVHVYTTPLNFKTNDTLELKKQAQVFFDGSGQFKWITAGDISRDGQEVLLKSYTQVYYWRRSAGEAIWQTLLRKPQLLPYTVEPQGEAIGFTTDGKGYYTVSEGVHALVYYYKLP